MRLLNSIAIPIISSAWSIKDTQDYISRYESVTAKSQYNVSRADSGRLVYAAEGL